ncbi:type II toxin-antitoxin system prevent-host-death family antitoxin [Mesorhizobium sp. IMUNJ 23232]|uniref:type II toxin-antitoxin system prevent-host-death family antitoxin n=1 Tax=Mesorhizobium sp. IMUNJ 23232 TaxID=3376064 RepID=UPI0037971B3F
MNAPSRMPTLMSSREFNQDTAKAKRAAAKGPVFITTRGEPTHVLLTKEEFDRLEKAEAPPKKEFRNLAEALADPRPEADFDWEPPRMGGFSLKVPDFE